MEKNRLSELWSNAQLIIRNRIGDAAFETWFSSLGSQEQAGQLIIIAPDEFFQRWVEEHYGYLIGETLNKLSGSTVEIKFTSGSMVVGGNAAVKTPTQGPPPKTPPGPGTSLNPRFTFEGFVVGSGNRFAHAACLAVAESPARAYNPLFIYGGVGLGKTHLMQAVVHQITAKNTNLKSVYITSERFTNELIDAIQHRTTNQFRQKYRNIDVLMIDDIQFIAGKESTQEEFFHTFNVLYDSHKQIVISSDRPPKAIANLEERLSSRFSWGLITDIQPPDFETRVAILRKKIEHEPIKVPEEVIFFIAQEIKTNIRELEGALVRVLAYSLMEERGITLQLCREILKDMVQESQKKISLDLIQKLVAEFFNINVNDLKNKRRNKNIVLPRQIAMYLAREMTALSLPEIGVGFGGKDHTTVLHSWGKIKEKFKEEGEIKNIVKQLINNINQ
ncbi:MAG: chromosomal replication initiator protein DnaA [Candidatus Omnitrophota bacterium]